MGTIGKLFLLLLNLSKSLLVVASKSDSALLILLRIFGFTLLNSSFTFEIAAFFISILVASEEEIALSSIFFSFFVFGSFSFFVGFAFLSDLYKSSSNLSSFICKLYLSKTLSESNNNLSLIVLINPFTYISPGNLSNSLFSKASIYLDTMRVFFSSDSIVSPFFSRAFFNISPTVSIKILLLNNFYLIIRN